MNKLKLGSFILIAAIFGACSIFDNGVHSAKIVGQWQWIRSYGGITGEVITRDSAGIPDRHFNFKFNHTFSFFRADTLVHSGTYSLKEKDGGIIISYNTEGDEFSSLDQRVHFQGSDTLILADNCADCYTNIYVRAE